MCLLKEMRKMYIFCLHVISRYIKLKKSKVRHSVLIIVPFIEERERETTVIICLYFPKEAMVGKKLKIISLCREGGNQDKADKERSHRPHRTIGFGFVLCSHVNVLCNYKTIFSKNKF